MTEIITDGNITTNMINGLVERNIITEKDAKKAISIAQSEEKEIQDVLIENNFVTKSKLTAFVESFLELPRVDLTSYVPDPDALKMIPKSFVHKYLILPLFEIEGVLTVALSDPLTAFQLDLISKELAIGLDPVLATEGSLIDAIVIYYGVSPDEMSYMGKNEKPKNTEVVEEDRNPMHVDLDKLAFLEGSAVSEILQEILLKAKRAEASAVHIEPIDGDFYVMFRIKGELRKIGEAARSLQKPLTECIKTTANIPRNLKNPAEKIVKIPRIGSMIISMYPTIHGERIVLSFEKEVPSINSINDLQINEDEKKQIKKILNSKNGLVLIGAPVNSGKTTTLRMFIKEANSETKSAFLLASEEVRAIPEVQFQKLRGDELLMAVEGLIHQDIDVVGIDEVDSPEVMRTVIRLSEKSLVLVTIEATDAVDAIYRVLEWGVEPFSLSWNLKAAVSLRALRKNCPKCLEEYNSPLMTHKAIKKYLGESPRFYRSLGCEECDKTRYKGYVVVYENILIVDSLRKKIATGFDKQSFKNSVRGKGSDSILKQAMEKVADKEVTPEEVYRTTGFKE